MTRRPGYDIDGQPTKVDPRDFPDPLTVPEPEQDTGYKRQGCSILPFLAAILLILLAGCSAQPAASATPSAAPETPEASALTAGEAQGQRGAPQATVRADSGLTLGTPSAARWKPADRGGAPPLTPEVLAGGTTYSGRLAWADPKYGPRYLALREPRGTRVLVCGPADCVEMTSNDYGPVYSLWKQGRIADVAVAAWERICGVPRRFGLCPGSIQILRRPQIALPATSTEEGP